MTDLPTCPTCNGLLRRDQGALSMLDAGHEGTTRVEIPWKVWRCDLHGAVTPRWVYATEEPSPPDDPEEASQ